MKKLTPFLFLVCGLSASAQTESTLYFMNSLPQVVDVNPAIMPRYQASLGLPFISSIGATYSNNGFTYNDLISRSDGVVKADLSKWSQGLAEKNYVTVAAQADLFRFGYRLNPKMYLMVSSTIKGYNRTMLPKGIATLLVDGTSPLVGSYSNTSPQQESLSYVENSAGMAYKVSNNLTLGVRLKYIKGLANVTTESSSLLIQVDDAYGITATGQADVRTSGVYNLTKSGYDLSGHVGDYLKNNGWGMDLGGTYKFMDKLTVGMSLMDIGYINWTNNTYQYTLDPAKAKYTFSGVDVNKLLDNNSSYLSAQMDSIKNKFQMKETPRGSYTTMLPGKLYLSGTYELVKDLSIGTLFFTEKFKGRYSSGMTASLNKTFGKWLSSSLTYTVSNRSYNNIGLGLSFNLAPIQLYIVGDNLVRAPVSLVANKNLDAYLNSSQMINFRAGLNFVLGWDKGSSKEPVVKDKSHNPKEKKSKSKVKTTYGRTPAKKKTSKVGR